MTGSKRMGWVVALLVSTFVATGGASAQDKYPSRAIDIIAGFGPGGTSATVAAIVSQHLSAKWGVPINVINKPGGNTVPAQLEMLAAASDGYTLYSDNIGSSSILQVDQENLPFNVLDKTFIATTNSNPMLLFVHPDSPIKNIEDLATTIKADPSAFTWTGVGVAAIPVRQLLNQIGVDVNQTKSVTSSGSSAATVLVAGGNVVLGIASIGPSMGAIDSGLVRPLAVTSKERWAALPDVPTTAELGHAEMYVSSWIGLTGPKDLPADIIKIWNDEIQAMLKDPEIVAKFRAAATEPDYRNSEQFRAQVETEIADFKKIWGK